MKYILSVSESNNLKYGLSPGSRYPKGFPSKPISGISLSLGPFQYIEPTQNSTLSVNNPSEFTSGHSSDIISHVPSCVSSKLLNPPIQSSWGSNGNAELNL